MLLLLFACHTEPEAQAAAPVPASTTPVSAACLEKGDKADGATDQLVHRCPNCSFVMDGEEKFSSTVQGYTVHSCSKVCKDALDKDPARVMEKACAHP